MIQEENKWKYKFNKDGKYTFEIVFKDIITDVVVIDVSVLEFLGICHDTDGTR